MIRSDTRSSLFFSYRAELCVLDQITEHSESIFLMSDLNVPLLVLVGAAIGYIAAGGQGWPTDQGATLAVRRTHREKRNLFVFGLFFDCFSLLYTLYMYV